MPYGNTTMPTWLLLLIISVCLGVISGLLIRYELLLKEKVASMEKRITDEAAACEAMLKEKAGDFDKKIYDLKRSHGERIWGVESLARSFRERLLEAQLNLVENYVTKHEHSAFLERLEKQLFDLATKIDQLKGFK